MTALDELIAQVTAYPKAYAEDMAKTTGYSFVRVDSSEGCNEIVAQDDQIAFMEYGTGFVAPSMEVEGVGEVGGGTWSEDHQRTYQNWQGDPMRYRYNKSPKYGMTHAIETMETTAETRAWGYFE